MEKRTFFISIIYAISVPMFISILFGFAGCGYFAAGTWEDDPDNWNRAFHSRKPDDVTVVHSKYSRFAHFTYEFEYFFHIEANETLHDQLFGSNDLIRVESSSEVSQYYRGYENMPTWFLPKPQEKYDAWQCRDRSRCTYLVFIDKDNHDIFITDRQL